MVMSLFKRPPDFMVGGSENPYLLRWWIIPRNPIFNIYLHKFLRDDEDRAMHDHPWPSLSITIKGEYIEWMPSKRTFDKESPRYRVRKRWSIVWRSPTHRHRIQLFETPYGTRAPAWTIFITGPRIREWGFWCPSQTGFRFVHWKDFTSPDDKGSTGRGCDE